MMKYCSIEALKLALFLVPFSLTGHVVAQDYDDLIQ